jgi:hypothetical protein
MKSWFLKTLVNTEKVEHLKTSNATCHLMFLLYSSKIDVLLKIIIEFWSNNNSKSDINFEGHKKHVRVWFINV